MRGIACVTASVIACVAACVAACVTALHEALPDFGTVGPTAIAAILGRGPDAITSPINSVVVGVVVVDGAGSSAGVNAALDGGD